MKTNLGEFCKKELGCRVVDFGVISDVEKESTSRDLESFLACFGLGADEKSITSNLISCALRYFEEKGYRPCEVEKSTADFGFSLENGDGNIVYGAVTRVLKGNNTYKMSIGFIQ